MKIFEGKSVFITGVCGTIGQELVKQLLSDENNSPREIICVDNNESAIFLLDLQYLNDERVRFFVVDIKERDSITELMRGVNIVFHLAALKHVLLCENSPAQALSTNIYGLQNIIYAANANFVEKVIFTSSDKAVNPTNVMGASKLMGERLITAANNNSPKGGPVFASTRFGNVLGSNGSVVPIFRRQITKGAPVTLTDRSMTRFVMSIQDSVNLVLKSAELAEGGEIFVTKMPAIFIRDLAMVMIEELAPSYNFNVDEIKIIEIGAKPGEKIFEELTNSEEVRRTVELDDFFIVLPAYPKTNANVNRIGKDKNEKNHIRPYISSDEVPLTKMEIKNLLRLNFLID